MESQQIIRPNVFADYGWLSVGMTTRRLHRPERPRLEVARELPRLAEMPVDTPVVVGEQVHDNAVAIVGGSDAPAPSAGSLVEVPAVDALVAPEPGVAVGIFTADCVPIVLVDVETHIVGVAHAGREGTLKWIAQELVRSMLNLECRTENMRAWVGPSISGPCYEVDPEKAAECISHFSHFPGAVTGDEQRNIALGLINWCQLLSAGMAREH
ncbi:MAG: laccase domain-containing protein, partial [Candidatus Sumerlaeota bacterium]